MITQPSTVVTINTSEQQRANNRVLINWSDYARQKALEVRRREVKDITDGVGHIKLKASAGKMGFLERAARSIPKDPVKREKFYKSSLGVRTLEDPIKDAQDKLDKYEAKSEAKTAKRKKSWESVKGRARSGKMWTLERIARGLPKDPEAREKLIKTRDKYFFGE